MWRFGLLALVACGRLDFDPVAGGTAESCAAELVDLGPWGAPTSVAAVNSMASADDDPSLAADGTELYFTSSRSGSLGGGDVYRAQRSSPQAPWGAVEHVLELSSASNENTPELSVDGLSMYLATDRAGTLGAEDLFVARRTDRNAPWGTPVPVPELNSASTDRGPSLFDHDLAIALHSSRPGGTGATDIYVATRATTNDVWSTPALLAGVNTAGTELRPWISPCGLEITFQRDPGTGTSMDFFVAHRGTVDEAFGAAVRIDDLSSTDYDQDLRLSPDRRTAVFSSMRGTSSGDLYLSTR